MSLLLEVLVAKGRRVQNPREQREVAFGLADLSTNPQLCIRIVAKGGISTLIRLLDVSKDVETQRLSALALSNIASLTHHSYTEVDSFETEKLTPKDDDFNSCSAKEAWGSNLETIQRIIHLLNDDGMDTVTRRYGALLFGNLAVDVDFHAFIVKWNGIYTLNSMLKFALTHQDLELGRCTAFAIANLTMSSTISSEWLESGTLESLVLLTCVFTEQWAVQTQVLIALRGIMCGGSDETSCVKAVQHGLLDSLVLMARSKDDALRQEAACTLYCLSTVDKNKNQIAQVAFATILSMALSGVLVVERYASSTLANIVESIDTHSSVLEHKGILSTLSILSSQDLVCQGEGYRILANLTSNINFHHLLLDNDCFDRVVDFLSNSKDSACCKYAALSIANFSANSLMHRKMVPSGCIGKILIFLHENQECLETRRYVLLALANVTASDISHHAFIVQSQGLTKLLAVENTISDPLSKFYIARTLRNISSNCDYHSVIVQQCWISPLILFTLSDDPDVRLEGVAALRSLSTQEHIQPEIVQECRGLTQIQTILETHDVELLMESTAYLCNLSFGLKARVILSTYPIIPILLTHVSNEYIWIVQKCCTCLAHLAETGEILEDSLRGETFDILITAMRNRDDDVRREAGRALANILSCSSLSTNSLVVEKGGHLLFISFLFSRDFFCQRVGAFGIVNLCFSDQHIEQILSAGALEPLATMANRHLDIECQRLSLLAIAKMASAEATQSLIVQEGIFNVVIPLSTQSSDFVVRNSAAVILSCLARNPHSRQRLISEGGLEGILSLARASFVEFQREVLPAITSLTFVNGLEKDLCFKGGLDPIIIVLNTNTSELKSIQLCCCAIANLSAAIEVVPYLVDAGVIPFLALALSYSCVDIEDEVFRSICNLAAFGDFSKEIIKHNVITDFLMNRLARCQMKDLMFALGAMSNLCREEIDIFDDVRLISIVTRILQKCQRLNPNDENEPLHLSLYLLINMSAKRCIPNEELSDLIDLITEFAVNFSIQTRRSAVLLLGNVCASVGNHQQLCAVILPILISYSFPTDVDTNRLSHFQAIAGLRGLAAYDVFRARIMEDGCLEPLFLTISMDKAAVDPKSRLEATICIFNLTCASLKNYGIIKSGIIEILSSVLWSGDKYSQAYAIASLGNLAEYGTDIQDRIIDLDCLLSAMNYISHTMSECGAHYESARLLALLSTCEKSHTHFKNCKSLISQLFERQALKDDLFLQQCGVFIVGNLAGDPTNHPMLIECGIFHSITTTISNDDILYKRCIVYTLKNLSRNIVIHQLDDHIGIIQLLIVLLRLTCKEIQLEACLALRYLFITEICRSSFLRFHSHRDIFKAFDAIELELSRECLAALWNLSISYRSKIEIFYSSGWNILLDASRSQDEILAYVACHTVANVSEASEIQEEMVAKGIVHHLTYNMRTSSSCLIIRETVRALSNISSTTQCSRSLLNFAIHAPLVKLLCSPDAYSIMFATMTLSNLTVADESQVQLLDEGCLPFLFKLLQMKEGEWTLTQRWAFITLTNLSSCSKCHDALLAHGIIDLIEEIMFDSHNKNKASALRCLSNLSTNMSIHDLLQGRNFLDILLRLYSNGNVYEQPLVASVLRGLSQSENWRENIICEGFIQTLVTMCKTNHAGLHEEILSTFCNISATETQSFARELYDELGFQGLESLLNRTDRASQLFAVLLLGNLINLVDLGESSIRRIIAPMIRLSKEADDEISRSVGLSLCNILAQESLHADVINEGGLGLIVSLLSRDVADFLRALSALRNLATFPHHRENIMRSELKENLLKVLGTDRKMNYFDEVWAIFYYLSLEDFCKEEIARYGHLFFNRTPNDLLTPIGIRLLANCCELPCCHHLVIDVVTTLLAIVWNEDDGSIICEVARLLSNISSSLVILMSVNHEQWTHFLLRLCESTDESTCEYGHISILNTYIMSRSDWNDDQRHYLLHGYCRNIGNRSKQLLQRHSPFKWPTLYFISKCITVDTARFITTKAISALTSDDLEAGFVASYTLSNVYPDARVIHESFVTQALNDFISRAVPMASSHTIAFYRKLCTDAQFSKELLCSSFIDSLLCTLERILQVSFDVLLSREIMGFLYNITSHGYVKLVGDSMLTSILQLSVSLDDECSRWALGVLANLTENLVYHSRLNNNETVTIAHRQILHGTRLVKRESCRLICNLLSSTSYHIKFRELNIMNGFTMLEAVSDECFLGNVALSVNKLASLHRNADYLRGEEIFICLQFLMTSSSHKVLIPICRALRCLSMNEKFNDIFIKGNVLQLALGLLHQDQIEIRCSIVESIFNVSLNSLMHRFLFDEGIVDDLIDICYPIPRNESIVAKCLEVLENLAFNEDNRRLLLKHKELISFLYELSDDERMVIQEHVIRLFSILTAQTDGLMNLHESLLLKTLTKNLLLDENKVISMYTAITIGNISRDCEQEWISQGMVKELIELLYVPQCSIHACSALSLLLNRYCHGLQYAVDNDRFVSQLLHLCSSDCRNQQTTALLAICNLSQYTKSHSKLMKYGLMTVWKTIRPFSTLIIQRIAYKILCNICRNPGCVSHIFRQRIICIMLEDLRTLHDESLGYWTWAVCSLFSQSDGDGASRPYNELEEASKIFINILSINWPNQQAISFLLFNLSKLSFAQGSKSRIIETCDRLGHFQVDSLRQSILMIIVNLSSLRYRQGTDILTRDGRLQWIISKMRDDGLIVQAFACLSLCNITSRRRIQNSLIALGPVHLLVMYLAEAKTTVINTVAALTLVNICKNQSLPGSVDGNSVIKHLLIFAKAKSIYSLLSSFIIVNVSTDLYLIWSNDASICTLVNLCSCNQLFVQSFAMSLVTKWAMRGNSFALLGNNNFLHSVLNVPEKSSIDLERDIIQFIMFLSRSIGNLSTRDMRVILHRLYSILCSDDKVVMQSASVSLANITEWIGMHSTLLECGVFYHINRLIRQECLIIRCEAMRALINLLNAADSFAPQASPLLDAVARTNFNKQEVEEYFIALILRKISAYDCCHNWFMEDGLITLLTLLRSHSVRTIRHGARAFRNLCSHECNVMVLNQTDGVDEILISLLSHETMEIKCIGLSVLSDLVEASNAASKVSEYGVSLIPLLNNINQAHEDLNARIVHVLVCISEYRTSQNSGFLIRSIDALIRLAHSKNREISQNVTHALFNFAANENNQLTMYHQGSFPCLMKLCNLEDHVCQRYSQLAICFLMTNPNVHKQILQEYDMIHELIVTANTSSQLYQSLAASSISSISSDEDVKSILMKKDALQSIFRLTESSNPDTRYDALFTMANFAVSPKFHHSIIDAGGVQLLKKADTDGNIQLTSCIARFFALLSISTEAQKTMIQENIVLKLIHFTRLGDPITEKYALFSLSNICFGSVQMGKALFQPLVPTLLKGLTQMSVFPNIRFNNYAALMISGISLLLDERELMPTAITVANIRALLDMLQFSYHETQVYACTALNILSIRSYHSIQGEGLYNDDILSSFISLIECADEYHVLSGLLTLGSMYENDNWKTHMMKADNFIRSVVGSVMKYSSNIPVLRAAGYFICLISESVENHSTLYKVGALESTIHLISQIDEECRDFGLFAIACFSRTKNLHVPLAKHGAIRPLVNILASDCSVESKHYATLALLRLADNFENHITIAEEGGIQALIELGNKSQYTAIQTKASLSLGHVACTLLSKN